jgi:RES domain-containing protein
MKKRLMFVAALVVASLGLASFAAADTTGSIGFESTEGYHVGDINGQPTGHTNTWVKTGPYDANVVTTSRFDFSQALQISNAVTSGSFGDQTYSPGVDAAGAGTSLSHFDASFKIGTALADYQPGNNVSVSPDNGEGARMSYLRFEEHTNGVHVYFVDVTDKGPVGTVAAFNEKDIATLSRGSAHTVGFSITFKTGTATDLVKITIDGKQAATGTSWKNYYRDDPEQTTSGNVVPSTSKLGFFLRGTAVPSDLANGYLFDNVTLSSS